MTKLIYEYLDNLSFTDYIKHCRSIIETRRIDLAKANAANIIDANSPCEFYPEQAIHADKKLKYGVLLVHGLLDCPFTFQDLGRHLQANGILSRSILLPGHGTQPEDLLTVTCEDWINAVRYGMESLSKEVDRIYLAGYSTGAALSVHQALQQSSLAGIILLAPAIRIKIPKTIFTAFHYLKKWLHINHNAWIDKVPEIDYAKYKSIPFNAVKQVNLLSDKIGILRKKKYLDCPMFMIISQDDETISSTKAIEFFSGLHHPASKLLLYTPTPKQFADTRIMTRSSSYPALNIQGFSHVTLPFTAANPHYGQQGDYPFASHKGNYCYGPYTRMETNISQKLYQLKLLKKPYRQLTFNPDFAFMAEEITKFIINHRM